MEDAISNIAGIYFDFKDPVITNLVSADENQAIRKIILSKENLTIVPNPATHDPSCFRYPFKPIG
ncbi:MAG: hypothetical protein IPP49_01990 [Saprospiraceae bacterium]|nr:hypothetical protein [Saprospiraceae bacterium]